MWMITGTCAGLLMRVEAGAASGRMGMLLFLTLVAVCGMRMTKVLVAVSRMVVLGNLAGRNRIIQERNGIDVTLEIHIDNGGAVAFYHYFSVYKVVAL
jgi:hypothetical protein